MVASATEFKKSGYTDEQAKQLSLIATMYQNVADSEMSAGDSASFIISQMKAFNIASEDAMSIIDKVNETSNNFAVSSTDISSALTKVSSSMSAYGNSIDESISLTVAGSEILTHQAGKVGRGLRSIGANISKLATSAGELEYSVNGVSKSLDLIDDQTGDMLNTYQVMERLSKDWGDMTAQEQANLGITVATKTQLDVFTATMSNFDTAVKAVNVSMNAQGSASKENARYMESMEAKIQALRAEYQELVLGKGGLSDFAKHVIEAGTNVLKLVNNLGGLTTILTTVAGIVVSLNIGKWITSLGTINKLFVECIQTIPRMTMGLTSATFAVDGMTASISALNLVAGGITLLITGLTIGISKYVQKQQELHQQIIESTEAIQSYSKELGDNAKAMQDGNVSLQKMIELNKELGGSYADANKGLIDENELIRENIDLLHEQAQIKAQEFLADQKNREQYEKAQKKVLEGTNVLGTSTIGVHVWDTNFMGGMLPKDIEKYSEEIAEYEKAVAIANSTTEEWLQINDELDSQTKSMLDILDEEDDLLEEVGAIEEDLVDITIGYESVLDDISGAYKSLTNAVDEYNNNGAMSIDTISELIKMGDGWINCLQIENGQMAINQDALLKVLEAKKEEQREIINATALKKLETLETEYLQKAEATNAEILDSETRSLALNTEQLYQNALQRARLNKEIKDGGYFADVKKIEAERQQALKLLDSVNLSSFSIGSSKASGSSKSSKSDVEKAQKEALQAQKDALKKEAEEAKKAINKEIDDVNDKINGLKKTISSVKDSYSDQIADLKELKEAKVAEIDAEIDALNKEKQARKDYWDEMLKDIEKENKERDRAIALEEKLQNISLASKKRLMVFKDGKFQYVKDEEAIAKAQADYDELLRKQEEERNKEHLQELRDQEQKSYEVRLEELKEFKSATQAEYDDQIKALEKLRDAIVDSINVEIESWEAKKDELQDTLKAQTEFYNNSLDALNDYVNNYNNTLSHMASPSTPKNDIPSEQPAPKVAEKPITTKTTTAKKSTTHKTNTTLSAFATGNNYVGDNQMALVGDNPNYREIVVGSKLNNDAGMLMSLKRGAGVVNASATNTLASLFNNRAVSSGTLVNNKANNNTTISIGNISLPEVKNGQDFVQYLQNFSMDLTQDSYRR